jgi:hypothetical protein
MVPPGKFICRCRYTKCRPAPACPLQYFLSVFCCFRLLVQCVCVLRSNCHTSWFYSYSYEYLCYERPLQKKTAAFAKTPGGDGTSTTHCNICCNVGLVCQQSQYSHKQCSKKIIYQFSDQPPSTQTSYLPLCIWAKAYSPYHTASTTLTLIHDFTPSSGSETCPQIMQIAFFSLLVATIAEKPTIA